MDVWGLQDDWNNMMTGMTGIIWMTGMTGMTRIARMTRIKGITRMTGIPGVVILQTTKQEVGTLR